MQNSRTPSDAMEIAQMKSIPTRPPGQSSHDDTMPFTLDAEPACQDGSPFVNPGPKASPSNRFPQSKFGKSPENCPSRHTGFLTRYGFENNTASKFSVAQAPPAAPSPDGTCSSLALFLLFKKESEIHPEVLKYVESCYLNVRIENLK